MRLITAKNAAQRSVGNLCTSECLSEIMRHIRKSADQGHHSADVSHVFSSYNATVSSVLVDLGYMIKTVRANDTLIVSWSIL